jgi:hypothetical protein
MDTDPKHDTGFNGMEKNRWYLDVGRDLGFGIWDFFS